MRQTTPRAASVTTRRLRFLASALPLVLASSVLPFHAGANQGVDASLFDRPAVLQPAVAFWREIFGTYSRHQVVIHSVDHPNKIFTVLDFRAEAASGMSETTLRRQREQDTRRAIERIDTLLGRIAEQGGSARGLGDEARAIVELFADFNDPGIYAKVQGRVRAQRGLQERTAEGLERAGRYLPYMEQVFSESGLPLALTRLPMVESSFNSDAYSHVHAAGMWQFMPGTARIYMRMDHMLDDRRDPWFSTHAAARHIADDYEMLKDWPLAVTAYNFGRFGIRRALERTEGRSLSDLIERYEGRRFGFASRNFYASFLGALDVEQARDRWFGSLNPQAPARFDTVETGHYVAWSTLQRMSGWDVSEFRRHNPTYGELVREDRLYVPPGHTIRVAPGQRSAFQRGYGALSTAELHSRQRDHFVTHRVAQGETLSHIARRYGTSARHVQQLNGIANPRSLRAGQQLRIPSSDAPSATATAAAPAGGMHEVQRGETLSHIARRYGTSVARLQAINALGSANQLMAGQRLRIPDGAVDRGASPATHTVRSGETLSHIAQQHGTSVAQLQAANSLGDRHVLMPGQSLQVPGGGATARTHTVRSGETLSHIAQQYGTSVAQLQTANGLGNRHVLMPGQSLQIPGDARAAPRQHTVLRGETLSQIASRYGVEVRALARQNNLRDLHSIRVGQTLQIP